MGNTFGQLFKVTTFGESHGPAIGVVIDGCPAGLKIDSKSIEEELARRKPGQSKITTQRKESDIPEILSGIFEGYSTGAPITIIIRCAIIIRANLKVVNGNIYGTIYIGR